MKRNGITIGNIKLDDRKVVVIDRTPKHIKAAKFAKAERLLKAWQEKGAR